MDVGGGVHGTNSHQHLQGEQYTVGGSVGNAPYNIGGVIKGRVTHAAGGGHRRHRPIPPPMAPEMAVLVPTLGAARPGPPAATSSDTEALHGTAIPARPTPPVSSAMRVSGNRTTRATRMFFSWMTLGGCWYCGDLEAWDVAGMCRRHRPLEAEGDDWEEKKEEGECGG